MISRWSALKGLFTGPVNNPFFKFAIRGGRPVDAADYSVLTEELTVVKDMRWFLCSLCQHPFPCWNNVNDTFCHLYSLLLVNGDDISLGKTVCTHGFL